MKVYAIARYTEDHYTWEDVFGVATNKDKAEAKVKADLKKLVKIQQKLKHSLITMG